MSLDFPNSHNERRETIELIDQDGRGWEIVAVNGIAHVPQDAAFMVVPAPLPGHCWSQIKINE